MNAPHTTIDISKKPELLRLAEEVKTSGKPRLLKNHRETVAVLMPADTLRQGTDTRKQTAYEAIKATVGSSKDIDTDALLAHIYRAREEGSRPPSRP
jgi:hypothetical protein